MSGPERYQRSVMERARVLCHESNLYRLQQIAHHYASLAMQAATMANLLEYSLSPDVEQLVLRLERDIIDSHREHFGCDPAWLPREAQP